MQSTMTPKHLKITLPKIFTPFYCKNLIRLGKENDGGYLVNADDVMTSDRLVSLGIKDDWSFDQDFADINDCDIQAYDGTVDEENRQLLSQFFTGHRRFVHANVGRAAGQIPLERTLADRTFLKCDIEGDEYHMLDEIIANSPKFTGIVMEFHSIQDPKNFNALTNFIAKIRQKLVHVHVNNWFYYLHEGVCIPDVIELTFTSSQDITWKLVTMPHRLDQPNCPFREDFAISFD